jgi:hypothetical protein
MTAAHKKPWLGQLATAAQAKASCWLAKARTDQFHSLVENVALFAVLSHVKAFHFFRLRDP